MRSRGTLMPESILFLCRHLCNYFFGMFVSFAANEFHMLFYSNLGNPFENDWNNFWLKKSCQQLINYKFYFYSLQVSTQ